MRQATPENIKQAALVIRLGGVVALPTETVYGLGANALDAAAVARIFEIKRRPSFDPLIVHAHSLEAAFKLVASVPPDARRLAERCWPGPLTLVLPKLGVVPDIVTSGLSAVGVRVPSHPVALEMLRQAGVPIAAPSANRFGGVSPTLASHVRDELGDIDDNAPENSGANSDDEASDELLPDLILDGGPCASGVESTVISFLDGVVKLLRPGALPIEEVEAIIGHVERGLSILDASDRPVGPGMLKRHYSPATPIELIAHGELIPPAPRARAGLLAITRPPQKISERYTAVESLCPNGTADLRVAAANLFACLRRLDAMKLDVIVAQQVDARGLGAAINDRLQRAAARE